MKAAGKPMSAMRLALNVEKVSHRTRTLIDVELECGCVITYEFEFVPTKLIGKVSAKPVKAEQGWGWWVSTSERPGEFTEGCKNVEECIADIIGIAEAKRDGFDLARRRVAQLAPSQKR